MSVESAAATSSPRITPLTENLLGNPSYNPAALLDKLLERFHLKNDAALSRMLEIAPPVISKIRQKQAPVGHAILVRVHEITGWSISDLRSLMGTTSPVKAL